MPQVAEDPHFKGQIKDINPKFIEYLKEFVSLNLAPENIIPKLMNGQPIHCEDLIQYFNSYMKIFKSDEMPEPKSVFEATAEANHLSALNFANDTYIEAMEAFFGADKSYFDKEALEKEHDKIKEQAMKVFDSRGAERWAVRNLVRGIIRSWKRISTKVIFIIRDLMKARRYFMMRRRIL